MADDRRPADRLLGLVWPPITHGLVKAEAVDRLDDIRAARDRLTDAEYAGRRSAALAGLTDNRHRDAVVAAAAGAYGAGCGAGSAYLFWAGLAPWAAALAAAAVPAAVVGLRMYRFWSAKRRLPVEDRLAVVAELARRGLVTPAEAADLEERIERLGRDRPGLHRRPADGPGPGWAPACGPRGSMPALPPPPPLRRALYVHFWWGSQEFELVASAAAVRTVASRWPEGEWADRKLAWLHCLGVRPADLRPDGPEPLKVTGYLIPAHYVTEAREWGSPEAVRSPPGEFLGIFPPNQPPPIIAVPLDELRRLVAELTDPSPN